MKLFKKILIANRGEIAVRIIKSAKKLGIKTVAIYSMADKNALHISMADEAYCIGEEELQDTYLNVDKIMEIVRTTSCDALHPGYGFLSESPLLVEACEKEGITFIGPHLEAIRLMGNKIEARAFVKKLDVPMTEGVTGSPVVLLKNAGKIPFPILVKAAAGGGGKGMRIVHEGDDLKEILESTSREAKNYFGDGTIYIEKYIEEPRHIEIQVLGDNFGNVVHLFERECSIQRRYQKIIEESPSPTLTPEVREKMGKAAVAIANEAGYNSAGTIEFLVDKDLNFYFLEMNTRIQVEHPVTEMVTGVDLVEEQILIAAGNPLRLKQENLSQNGNAIECRIYAEDPQNNFLPAPGKMTLYQEPLGPGIRVDSGIDKAVTVSGIFDPMISKMVVWAESRDLAIEKSIDALKNYHIQGIRTNISFLLHLLKTSAFERNAISTKFCDDHTAAIIQDIEAYRNKIGEYPAVLALALHDLNLTKFQSPRNVWESIGFWRNLMVMSFSVGEKKYQVKILKQKNESYQVEIDGRQYDVTLNSADSQQIDFSIFNRRFIAVISFEKGGRTFFSIDGADFVLKRTDILLSDEDYFLSEDGPGENSLFAPMPGKVIKVNVKAGDEVKRGTVLLVVEAMKMENNIVALTDAIVENVNVVTGERVDTTLELVNLLPMESNRN
ncbi:MAG: acetyl-CoA carboxylase biotin carboxylase subunit [Bacteroidales bacterium]|nr:acetyl-CoA carboxylase biotin carboxylase subunit [Bacteroidales bacterium]